MTTHCASSGTLSFLMKTTRRVRCAPYAGYVQVSKPPSMAIVSYGPAWRSATLAARFGMNQTWRSPGWRGSPCTKRVGALRALAPAASALTTEKAAVAAGEVWARGAGRGGGGSGIGGPAPADEARGGD